MTQLIVILFVLFIAGALIAAMGDRLGTYIGKKRLSSLGLRPRHTAMLYTMLFGGLISVLTLLTVIAISSDFKRALIHGTSLIQSNRNLQTRLEKGQRQLVVIQNGLYNETQEQQIAVQREAQAERQRAAAEHSLAISTLSLTHTQLELDHRQRLLARQQELLSQSVLALDGARQGLRIAQATLESTRLGLSLEKASLAGATHTVQIQELRVTDLEHQSNVLESSVKNLTSQNQTLQSEHDTLEQQPLIYSKGQELGRTVMSTNQTYSDIRNQVVTFLEQISQNAMQLHGKLGKNGRAVIMLPYDVDDQSKYTPDNLTEDQTIDNLAHGIQDADMSVDSVVLVATAHVNSFAGDQTEARVLIIPNYMVYQKGTLISSAPIDGSQPLDVLLGSLQQFLLHDVSPSAWKHGIIPVVGRNGEVTLGAATDSSQTLALMKQIQAIGPGAIVSAYAASDTYRNGPLHIKMTASAPGQASPPAWTSPPIASAPANPI